MKTPGATTSHIARVDVLRAVAFLGVFAFHLVGYYPDWKINWNGPWRDYSGSTPIELLLSPVMFGWLGVALFFVISGFCIHYSVLKMAGGFSAAVFFERRFLRIYPAYIVNVAGCLLLLPWLPSKYLNLGQVAAHILLIHNLIKVTFDGINWVLWSLGVEWQFYLLFPLLWWGRKRIGLPGCLIVSLILNVLCQIFFSVRFALPGIPISSDWSFPLVTWCDWILGACLAEALVEKRPLFPHHAAMLAISLALLLVGVNFKPLSMQSFLLASVFFAAVMDRYLAWTEPLGWFERLLAPIGLVSYSLYLWHQVVIRLGMSLGKTLGVPINGLNLFLIYLPLIGLVTGLISVASYYWVEVGVPQQIRRWRGTTK